MSEDDDESAPSVASGVVVAGRYRVERRVGAGGMGEVYLVQHVHTDERFAMKVLLSTVISDSSALERFRREARTPARIDSDHVVRVTDADVAPELKGAPFLVMEYLRGEDLDKFVELNGPMNPQDVVTYLQQISRALDKAHALGIVHRDLKPENIFITRREDGSPLLKVLDFGIAKFTSGALGDLANKTATSPGQIYGTPLYMSPEQAKGDSKAIAAQTDIWALGLIASRMLSGRDYWDAETLTALIAQVVYEPMRKPSELGINFGDAYDAWFLKCCDRDQSARFATAGEAIFRLGQALGVIDANAIFTGSPVVIAPPSPSMRSIAPLADKGLSKTEIQLAQTSGTIPNTGHPPARASLMKVAVGATAVGAVLAIIVFGFLRQQGKTSHTPAQPELDPPAATAATQTSTATAPAPTPTVMPAPTLSASASAAPSATASASAVPVELPSATAVRPKPKPTTTATAPTAAVTADPKPKKNPLDGRL